MKHEQKRLEAVANKRLSEIAGNFKHYVSIDVSGPGLVIAGNPPQPQTGWHLGIALEHMELLPNEEGEKPRSCSVAPMGGTLPSESFIRQVVDVVWADVLKERARVMGEKDDSTPLPAEPVVQERPKFAPRERESHFASKPGSDAGLKSAQ